MRRNRLILLLFVSAALWLGVMGLVGIGRTTRVAAESTADFPIIADFEGGVPAGWFVYGDWGNVSINLGTTVIADSDPDALPGQIGNNEVLSGTVSVPTWGGFGAGLNPVQDWSDYDAVSFWFYGSNSGTTHEFEIQTAPGDDRRATFVDSFSGWRQIILPFSTFGAGGAYDVTQVDNWVFVLDGTVGSFKLDALQLVNIQAFADFEGGVPAGWFVYGDWGNITVDLNVITVADSDPDALPGQVGNNDVLSGTVNVPTWAGFGAGFNPLQDWSAMQGVSFWFYGENSGTTHEFEIQTTPGDDRRATFVDNFNGWQLISLPFTTFGNTPYDVSQVDNWVFVLDGTVGSFKIDHLSAYGDAGSAALKAAFENSTYAAMEGETAMITVTLNMESAETVTVTYATSDGSATAGIDYTAAAGQLIFAPGETAHTFSVETIDNSANDDERTVILTLSDPVNAELGAPNPATLIIGDDETDSPSGKNVIVEDFESGELPMGVDPYGIPVGYSFYAGGSSTVAITITDSLPAPVPGSAPGNLALQEDLFITSGSYSGFLYSFTNDTADEWLSQDWSSYAGIGFWLYGNNTGGIIFLDILDNRNPGSTTDDAERWSIDISDNFDGWQYFEIAWSELHRKDIGNGAPNDGLNLTEVHGYAFGGFGSQPIDNSYYIDNVSLIQRVDVIDDFEDGLLPSGTDPYGIPVGYFTVAGGGGAIDIAITDTPPTPVPGAAAGNKVLEENMTLPPGAFAVFINAFSNETYDAWTPVDWSGYEGVCFWLYGHNTGGILFLDVIDNRNPDSTVDDAERWSIDIPDNFDGWQFFQFTWDEFHRKEIGNGAPNDGFGLTEVHGYAVGGFGSVDMGTHDYYLDTFAVWGNSGADAPLLAAFERNMYTATEGETAAITVSLTVSTTEPVTVTYASAESKAIPGRDFTPVVGAVVIPAGATSASFSVPTIDEAKHDGDKNVMLVLRSAENAELGFQRQAVLNIVDNDPVDLELVDDFEGFYPYQTLDNLTLGITEIMAGASNALPGQGDYEQVLTVAYDSPAGFARTFVEPRDWTGYTGLSFWFYGNNSGQTVTVELQDNQAATTADTPPGDWVLVWSDEFNDPAGTPPNPNIWSHEIGDGSLNGIPGWGNAEFQYYNPANAAADGAGNLVITVDKLVPDTDLVCYYGPCEYSSARLVTKDKSEYEYGRLEARIQVPPGEDGLWPAFWSLGTNIDQVGWPQTGEMDIMEYVSRIPNEIFGTIHGPGYSGGSAYGAPYDFGEPVAHDYHTFAIEWGPDEIHWYVDGINYHNATPDDVAPNEWVYNHPFYLLLNVAIGGNFGGSISPDLTFPQQTLVDYVRVYQAPDSAERFDATFTDNFSGWHKVTLPFANFTRSSEQPADAPNDGLGLDAVWGYGFKLPAGDNGRNTGGQFMLDQVRLVDTPTSTEMTSYGGGNPASWLPLLLGGLAVLGSAFVVYRRRTHA